jgi:putative hydrolase of the HAD superfamily
MDFLDAVKSLKKRVVLVTNAHGKALAIKFRRTQLGDHFDAVVCAHDLGIPKEHVGFWGRLQEVEPFDKAATLLIDDSLPVLRAASRYGIGQLLTVCQPDSRMPEKDGSEFRAIRSFREIMPSH